MLHNLTQPDWVLKKWPNYNNKSTIEIIVELRTRERNQQFNQTELYRLSGGLLLGLWIQLLEKVVNGFQATTTEKMSLFSSVFICYLFEKHFQKAFLEFLCFQHDGTLYALKYAIQAIVPPNQRIPYASCVILELYSTLGDDNHTRYDVELFNRQHNVLVPLKISGCHDYKCPLNRILEIFRANAIFSKEDLYSVG